MNEKELIARYEMALEAIIITIITNSKGHCNSGLDTALACALLAMKALEKKDVSLPPSDKGGA